MSRQNSGQRKFRVLLMIGMLFAGENAMSIEQPDYTVVYQDGNIEYRQYQPYLVAETVIENADARSAAGNQGFRRLFQYITGSNQRQAKIDMTAPVAQAPSSQKIAMTAPVQQAESAEGWSVAFMLPTEYTMETAPVPTDERVQIRAMPGRLMAVLRYSGRWTESNFAEKQALLRYAIDSESIDRIGDFQSALYDPPYTPPLMRRNEVMVQVNRVPAAAEKISAEQVAAY